MDDVLGKFMGRVLVGRAGAHVGERQHADRRLLGGNALDRALTRQVAGEFLRPAVALFRISRQGLSDYRVQPPWNVLAQLRGRRRLLGEAFGKALLTRERRLPRKHLVKNATKTVYVAAPIECAVAE